VVGDCGKLLGSVAARSIRLAKIAEDGPSSLEESCQIMAQLLKDFHASNKKVMLAVGSLLLEKSSKLDLQALSHPLPLTEEYFWCSVFLNLLSNNAGCRFVVQITKAAEDPRLLASTVRRFLEFSYQQKLVSLGPQHSNPIFFQCLTSKSAFSDLSAPPTAPPMGAPPGHIDYS